MDNLKPFQSDFCVMRTQISGHCTNVVRHDIAEILLKVALNTKNQSITNMVNGYSKFIPLYQLTDTNWSDYKSRLYSIISN